jgi:ATP-binding cassette subfamily G (WHITE) protein 1
MVLSEGKVVYFGPAMKAVDHFKQLGHDCDAFTNPADFICKLLFKNYIEDTLSHYGRISLPR